MFSNVFKIAISISLLASVSAMAQLERDASVDATRDRDSKAAQDKVKSNKTTHTMGDQADEQALQLRQVDPNSAAAKTFGKSGTTQVGGSQETNIFRLKLKSAAGQSVTMDGPKYKQSLENVLITFRANPAEGEKALTMVQRADAALKGQDLSPAAIQGASTLVVDVTKVESIFAGKKVDGLSVDSAAEMAKTYYVDVEKVSGKNRSDFKAGNNADLIYKDLATNSDKYETQAKNEGVSDKDLFKACLQKAAYNVIAGFHSLDKSSPKYMSVKDMEELAKEIANDPKKCLG